MTAKTAKSTQTRAASAARVALYLRISADGENDKQAVQRQEKESRQKIAAQYPGAKITLYVDNDTSADDTKSGYDRPRYEAMMRDARAHKIDVIVAWTAERLTRALRECEDVLDLHDEHGVGLMTMGGVVDLASPMGRMAFRIYIVFAKAELEQRRYRQLAERRQKAEQGRVHKGGKRPYGYADDKMTIVEHEAAVVREAAERVLAGESMRSIVSDLAERGVTGEAGTPMTQTRLRSILISARISGRREHWQSTKRGEARPALAPIVAVDCWPAIISVEQSDRLRSLLTSQKRLSHHGNARVHLLPGFLRCSLCGAPMQSMKINGRAMYACALKPGEKCRKTITAARVEEVVTYEVMKRIDTPKYRRLVADRVGIDKQIVSQLALDEHALIELAEERARGDLEYDEWKVQRDIVKDRIDVAKAHIEDATHADALARLLAVEGDLHERFAAMTLGEQRAVLGSAVEKIVIKPPSKPGRTFDPTRVEVLWRG